MKFEKVKTRIGRKSFPALRSAASRPATILRVAALAFAAASLWAQPPAAQPAMAQGDDVYFVQLSDTHWGFNNPKINPDFAGTLKKAIAQINALDEKPDFIVFSGDETHTTDDPAVRRQRMAEFKDIISALSVRNIKFLPGEHDASLDNAKAYGEFFGETHYAFDLKGVHFIALDNVTDPTGSLGEAQLGWLAGILNGYDKDSQIVVFAHRPLIPVYTQWGWRTRDGEAALALLKPFRNVSLFYGHIHQERRDAIDGFVQYAAQGMMFPLPAPGSVDKPNPVAWDPEHPYRGLGYRTVRVNARTHELVVTEYPILAQSAAAEDGSVVKVVAKRFEFSPDVIRLKKGVTVTLELSTLDVTHGFNCPDLGISAVIMPDKVTTVSVTPDKAGKFAFFCDVFCGEGHDGMTGTIVVE